MVWSRESAAVFPALRAFTSGRMPAKTLRRSSRASVLCARYSAGRLQNELDLLLHGATGSSERRGDRRIGGADQRMAMPGNGEHHAAIAGVRHHDGAIAGQKRAVEHQVHSLARRDHRRSRSDPPAGGRIAEGAGRIDHDLGHSAEALRRVSTSCADHAVHETLAILCQAGDLHIVEQSGALLAAVCDQVDQAGGNRQTGRRSRPRRRADPSVLIVGRRCERLFLAKECCDVPKPYLPASIS